MSRGTRSNMSTVLESRIAVLDLSVQMIMGREAVV